MGPRKRSGEERGEGPPRQNMTGILKAHTRRTVLVVEDALTTRCILEQFFARAGCEVERTVGDVRAVLRVLYDFFRVRLRVAPPVPVLVCSL